MSNSTVSKEAVVVERTFDVPVALIWQLWTQPEHFKNWYGPKGFTVPVAEMDVRVGGKHLFCMSTPDGSMKLWTTGEYLEVVPHERLVYTDTFADEHGNAVSPTAYGIDQEHPLTTEITVELQDLGGRTRMVLTHTGVPASEDGASAGWEQTFDKLANHLVTVLNAK